MKLVFDIARVEGGGAEIKLAIDPACEEDVAVVSVDGEEKPCLRVIGSGLAQLLTDYPDSAGMLCLLLQFAHAVGRVSSRETPP